MTKLFAVFLACSAILIGHAQAKKEDAVKPTDMVGGPHGSAFDDSWIANAAGGHKRLIKITAGPCLDGVDLTYLRFEYATSWDKGAATRVVEHGTLKKGQPTFDLVLEKGEYINKVTVAPVKKKVGLRYKTRIGGVVFFTASEALRCGARQGNKTPVDLTAGDDRAFLYFSGSQGETIDSLVGHTIPKDDYF